jgi:integrase
MQLLLNRKRIKITRISRDPTSVAKKRVQPIKQESRAAIDERHLDILARGLVDYRHDDKWGYIARVIMYGLATGCRVEEIQGGRYDLLYRRSITEVIDGEVRERTNWLITLPHSKNHPESRNVKIKPWLYPELERWIEANNNAGDRKREWIFSRDKRYGTGMNFSDDEPSRAVIDRDMKLFLQMLGIWFPEKRYTPHSLRHTYITWELAIGVNPVHVRGNVGHRSLDQTMYYAATFNAEWYDETPAVIKNAPWLKILEEGLR